MFRRLDSSGDGTISWDEFALLGSNDEFAAWMSALEIDIRDLRGLWNILDIDGDGNISADEFIAGATRIKGTARSVDIISMIVQLRQLDRKIDKLRSYNLINGQ